MLKILPLIQFGLNYTTLIKLFSTGKTQSREIRMKQHERLKYRILRQLKNLAWHIDYALWFLFSPYKFKKIPKINKVLVIEDIGIGDLLVTTPVIRALRNRYGTVDVLVKPGMESVLEKNPHVNKVITKIEENYDLGVILHARTNGNYNISKTLKEKCKFRIGCTRVGLREGRGFFLNRKTKPNFQIKTKIQDNLDVIRTIGVRGDETINAYTDFKPPIKNYIVFHTHGAYKTHNWYPEKWIELAKHFKKTIVFTGTDKEYVNTIHSQLTQETIDATKTTIQEYFGWIKHADVVITVDTSAMHVAAAFNKKVISLFGAGDPRIWKPNTHSSKVILKGDCHSCHLTQCALKDHRCMQSITPAHIINLID